MKPEKDIERFVEHIDVDTHIARDRHVLETVLKAHEDVRQERQPPTWRIVMKSNTAKLATAAMILVAIGLSVTVLDRMAAPAWALDQTIEALKNVQAVYIAGRVHYPDRETDTEFEMWARPQRENSTRSGDCRYREGDHHLCVASETENVTYVCERYQNPKQDVVYITEGLNRGAHMFPSGDLLAEFKEMAEDWQEEIRKDLETGKSYAYITFSGPAVNTAEYWQIQVDLETKLPVRTAVWFDEDRQGQPHYEFTKLQYDPEIPEGSFNFEAPADAQIVDCRELDKQFAENPNIGTSVDQLELEGACMKIVTAYWKALIAEDWNTVQTLRPLATGKRLADLKAAYADHEPIGQVRVSRMNHLNDPGTFVEVFCVVKVKDGTVKHSLLNVDVRETTAGRLGVVAGAIGPEFYEAD